MLIVALSVSPTSCGWSVFDGPLLIGSGAIGNHNLAPVDYARAVAYSVRRATKGHTNGTPVDVFYETRGWRIRGNPQNDVGRILQAIGADSKLLSSKIRYTPAQAKKDYQLPKQSISRLYAVALGHRAVKASTRAAPVSIQLTQGPPANDPDLVV